MPALPRRTRWTVAALAVALLAVAVLATAMATGQPYRTDGHCAPKRDPHRFPAKRRSRRNVGVSLPANPTLSDIVIESVEPVGVKALDVIGVAVITPGPRGGIASRRGLSVGHPVRSTG